MIKGKDILGCPIIAIASGERIENVQDIVFDHDENEVLGFLVEEGGWFNAAKIVLFSAVKSIGDDAIMVASVDDVVSTKKNKRVKEILDKNINLIGMTLLTTDGQDLGKIADVYFDELTGIIEGYEATGGFFADLTNGRTFIPAPEDIKVGTHAAIVPISAAFAMQEKESRFKKAVGGIAQSVKSTVQSTTGTVKEKYEDAAEAVKDKIDEAEFKIDSSKNKANIAALSTANKVEGLMGSVPDKAEDAAKAAQDKYVAATDAVKEKYEDIADANAEKQRNYVIGKEAGREIVADDSTVIIRKGETVTGLHAEVAEWHGKLPALAASVTLGSITGAYAGAAGSVKASVQNVTDGIKAKVENTTDAIKEKYEDIANANAEKQKDYVIGKNAGADVVTDDDVVIAAKGDVITQTQADRAEKYGKLTALATSATGGVLMSNYENTKNKVQDSYADIKGASVERQKAYAVGKIAGTNVKTDTGELVAAKGSTITTFQVDRAEATGILGALVAAATGGAIDTKLQTLRDNVDSNNNDDDSEEIDPNSPQAAIGRRAKKDVRSATGSLVAAQGQIITPAIVDRAKHLGAEEQLHDATARISTTLKDTLTDAKAGASATLSSVSEGATGLFNKAKAWLGEQQDALADSLDTQDMNTQAMDIRRALGRPVNRVILAPNDIIILQSGDIVTNKAVQAARDYKVLDILLASISEEEPKA